MSALLYYFITVKGENNSRYCVPFYDVELYELNYFAVNRRNSRRGFALLIDAPLELNGVSIYDPDTEKLERENECYKEIQSRSRKNQLRADQRVRPKGKMKREWRDSRETHCIRGEKWGPFVL